MDDWVKEEEIRWRGRKKEGKKRKEKILLSKPFQCGAFICLPPPLICSILYPVIFQQLSEPLRPPYVRVAGHSGL